MACEKCWQDAYVKWITDPTKTQAEHYRDLLEYRKESPCSADEQEFGNPAYQEQ